MSVERGNSVMGTRSDSACTRPTGLALSPSERSPKDSGYARTPRNTPAASRGQAAPANEADKAKRTDKTGGRGTDLEGGLPSPVWAGRGDRADDGCLGLENGNPDPGQPPAKPRKRTEGSIVVPELPWKRGGGGG